MKLKDFFHQIYGKCNLNEWHWKGIMLTYGNLKCFQNEYQLMQIGFLKEFHFKNVNYLKYTATKVAIIKF